LRPGASPPPVEIAMRIAMVRGRRVKSEAAGREPGGVRPNA
jgi:hypothetical protein